MAKKKTAKKIDDKKTPAPKAADPDNELGTETAIGTLLFEAFKNGDPPDEIVTALKTKLNVEVSMKKVTKAMDRLGEWFDWTKKKFDKKK